MKLLLIPAAPAEPPTAKWLDLGLIDPALGCPEFVLRI
jgi:hypothetical protein